MARISTHVLDIARGRPAGGIAVDLYRWNGSNREMVRSTKTNADGRTDEPLLQGIHIPMGEYELVFQAGEYLRAWNSGPLFLDVVTIRFRVAESHGDYHVPLLLAPHGYSTYRGS